MPLELIAPGRRKANTYWVARGTVGGRRVEVSTKTRDKAAAEKFAADLTVKLLGESAGDGGAAPPIVTFAEAAKLYMGFRQPSRLDRRYVERLVDEIGTKAVGAITHSDLVAAANALYPGLKAATRNRHALRPAAAVLHYAAENKFCPWLRVRLFKEPKATTRAASRDVATLLLANTTGKQQLLLAWIFAQGTRITDTLRIGWPELDLTAATVKLWVSKTQEWRTFPLDDELVVALANEDKKKPLWPWKTRSGVYDWLGPLAKRLGVTFTPHMARHSVGTWLNAQGAGLRTIMAALGHDDPKSSLRYQAADVDIVRAAQRKLRGA